MRAILLPAPRHGKSSRGTPRLRRLPGALHGALRRAAQTTRPDSWICLRSFAQDVERWLSLSLAHSDADMLVRGALLHPVAASGGVLVRFDWPALTPALTGIKLLVAAC